MSDTSDSTGRDPFDAQSGSEPTDGDATAPVPSVDEGHIPAATPYAAAPAAVAAAPARTRRTLPLVPIVVVAAVAALLGGAVGAVTAVAVEPHDTSAVGTATGGGTGGTISIKSPATATAISAVAAKASPSVVTISVTESSGDEAGTGSGIVLTSDGDVLTNTHVVTLDGASSAVTISVTTSDGRIYPATVVKTDPTNDLAVIKLTGASGLQPATFADSSKLDVGDAAIAIGAPLGLSNTVTDGIVSALDRSISVQSSAVPNSGSDSGGSSGGESPFGFPNFGGGTGTQTSDAPDVYLSVVQTDAAINPGNSGGPLLNSSGQVIGVNVAIAGTGSSDSSDTQSGSIGVGFAIPSNIAHRIALELMKGEKATHGLLGVVPADPTSTSTRAGATVMSLTSGGAADKAGLKVGDLITVFNGVSIASSEDLTAQVRSLPGGATTTLTYLRGGDAHTVTVHLGTFKG